jgi:hypothetical protein
LDNLNSTEAIRPDLYPPILQALLFYYIQNAVLVAKTQEKTTLFEYLNGLRKQNYLIGFWRKLLRNYGRVIFTDTRKFAIIEQARSVYFERFKKILYFFR